MADARITFRIQVRDLTLHGLHRWVRDADDTFGHTDVSVVARRNADGAVFLEAGGSPGVEEGEVGRA